MVLTTSQRSWLHTNINLLNLLCGQDLPHLLGQLNTHVLPAAVNRNTVDAAVRSSQVDVLEYVGGVRSWLYDLAEVNSAVLLAEDCLARLNVDDVGKSKLSESNRFRCKEVILGSRQGLRRSRAKAKRANAVCVSIMDVGQTANMGIKKVQSAYLKPRIPKPVTIAVQA